MASVIYIKQCPYLVRMVGNEFHIYFQGSYNECTKFIESNPRQDSLGIFINKRYKDGVQTYLPYKLVSI